MLFTVKPLAVLVSKTPTCHCLVELFKFVDLEAFEIAVLKR